MHLIRALRCLATRNQTPPGQTVIHVGTDVIRIPTTTNTSHQDHGDRPRPPAEGECCGQGCQKCVWIEYGNDLIDYYKHHSDKAARSRIEEEIKDPIVRAFVLAELKQPK